MSGVNCYIYYTSIINLPAPIRSRSSNIPLDSELPKPASTGWAFFHAEGEDVPLPVGARREVAGRGRL
ncbi:MAG: hypothetical protein WC568_04305 [Candidatus Methanoperedens sp.]